MPHAPNVQAFPLIKASRSPFFWLRNFPASGVFRLDFPADVKHEFRSSQSSGDVPI
jgi:hypothetical protein